MSIWINKTNYHVTKKYALLVSTRWMIGLCQHCLCISLCMQREGDKGLNVPQLQELYFTWCAHECNKLTSKQKHGFSEVLLPANIKLLSETQLIWAFWSFTYWQDRLRWVTFSAENVSQLISYDYISGKLEQIYPEKQQDSSEKDNGSKHKEGNDARRRNAG